jgi:hypothetical protein
MYMDILLFFWHILYENYYCVQFICILGPFHQSLVAIVPVVSEEKIKMWNVDGWTTDDGRKVMAIAHMTYRPGELKT